MCLEGRELLHCSHDRTTYKFGNDDIEKGIRGVTYLSLLPWFLTFAVFFDTVCNLPKALRTSTFAIAFLAVPHWTVN